MASSVRVRFYIQPRASKTEAAGMHDGHIKIRLAAPPVDGAANEALVAFLAERLRIARSRVRIVAGLTSRRKLVEIEGVTTEMVATAL